MPLSDLGELLELLHGHVSRPFTSVRMTGHEAGRPMELWWQAPDRKRIVDGSGSLYVFRGTTYWMYHPEHGSHSNEDTPNGLTDTWSLDLFLHPRGLLATALEVTGRGEVAGRPAIEFGVSQRPSVGRYGVEKWGFADSYDAAIDAETGVILRAGEMGVDEIAYDEPFDDTLFQKPDMPADVKVHAIPTFVWIDGGLDELKRRVDFPLSVPRVLPAGARLVSTAIVGDGDAAWAQLIYVVDPGAMQSIIVMVGPGVAEMSRAERARDWTAETVDGIEIQRAPENQFGYEWTYTELAGVQAYVRVQPGREAATAAITSLEPA